MLWILTTCCCVRFRWPNPPRRRKGGRRFSYLCVDEFQDISPLQYQLLMAWNRNGKELFVIGDPDQAIYGFRGSDGNVSNG